MKYKHLGKGLRKSDLLNIFHKSPLTRYYIDRRTLKYHMDRLEEEGWIKRSGRCYSITDEGIKMLHKYDITDSKIEMMVSDLTGK